LLRLIEGPKSRLEIQQLTGLNKDTVCSNLRILRGIKAVVAERRGRRIVYHLKERPLFKWLIFRTFIGSKTAFKTLKDLRRMFLNLPKVTQQIGEMYTLVGKYRAEYEKLREKMPELEHLDVWDAIWVVKQFQFNRLAKQYKTISWTRKLRGDYSRDKFLKSREEFAKLCRELDAVLKNPAEYVLFTTYYQFLKTFFPEVINFSEKHRIKNYENLLFNLASEFDKLATQLVEERRSQLDEFCKKLKRDVDEVYEYVAKFLSD
jgi:DNA repair ATPase RecN